MRRICSVGIVLSLVASAAHAQDSTLTRLLLANRLPIMLEGGALAGVGGRRMVDDSRTARFVMVGEEHGVAEVPIVVGALLRELRPAGFGTLAIEVSPLRGQELDAMARSAERRGNVSARLDSSLSSWRTTIPFYVLAEEREMLRAVMEGQGSLPPMRIWGLDYEVSADRQYLEELQQLVPSAGAAVVRAARTLADEGFSRLLSVGDPSRLFAFSASDSVVSALRAALGPRPTTRAVQIVDLLGRTAQINRPFLSGRLYESNLDRSKFLRENFSRAFRAASVVGEKPKVVFKFGGSHMMRGVNYTHTLDLGTAASIMAENDGERSYHVLLLGGTGTHSSRMNIAKAQYESNGVAEVDGRMLAWLKPALPDSGWALFDLKAVRMSFLRSERTALTPQQDRFLHAYDAIVVLGGSRPGTLRPLRTSP